MRFLGGITKVYDVYFLHQRNDEVEYETIEANSEKDAIKLAIGQDVIARIDERADKSYSTQVYYAMSIGASRMEEEKVVQIACDE